MGRRALPRAAGLRFAAACLVLVCAARVAGQNELESDSEGSGVDDEGGQLAGLDLNSSSAVFFFTRLALALGAVSSEESSLSSTAIFAGATLGVAFALAALRAVPLSAVTAATF